MKFSRHRFSRLTLRDQQSANACTLHGQSEDWPQQTLYSGVHTWKHKHLRPSTLPIDAENSLSVSTPSTSPAWKTLVFHSDVSTIHSEPVRKYSLYIVWTVRGLLSTNSIHLSPHANKTKSSSYLNSQGFPLPGGRLIPASLQKCVLETPGCYPWKECEAKPPFKNYCPVFCIISWHGGTLSKISTGIQPPVCPFQAKT